MAAITIELPSLLEHCTEGAREIALAADTVGQAVDTLIARYPLLEVHIFNADRSVRRFVLIFHNDVDLRRVESWDIPLAEGDRITVLQSVAGG